MKTTLDLPEDLFKRAKIFAISHGFTFKDLVSEALEEKMSIPKSAAQKPWMKLAGVANTPELREELARMEKIIEENFEQIEDEDWK